MTIYNYKSTTGEFISESTANENPLEAGEFLIPANATTMAPPEVPVHNIACFDPAHNTWSIQDDYRNETYYYISTKEKVEFEVGMALTPDMTLSKPLYDEDETFNGSVWELDPAIELERIRETQRNIIRDGFNIESVKPVTFNGGIWHGGLESATKLDGAKRFGELVGATEVTFYDTSRNPHTLSIGDANGIIATVAAKYQTDFSKKETLLKQIDNATLEESIIAIVW